MFELLKAGNTLYVIIGQIELLDLHEVELNRITIGGQEGVNLVSQV